MLLFITLLYLSCARLLIATASDPACRISGLDDLSAIHEFDVIELVCYISSVGNWLPTFSCWFEGMLLSWTDTSRTENRSVSRYRLNVTRAHHDKAVSCEMSFNQSNNSSAFVTSSTYNWTWISSHVYVLYGPVIQEIFQSATKLHCHVNGYPPPTITWNVDGMNSTYAGSEFDLCDVHLLQQLRSERSANSSMNDVYEVRCVASETGSNQTTTKLFQLTATYWHTLCISHPQKGIHLRQPPASAHPSHSTELIEVTVNPQQNNAADIELDPINGSNSSIDHYSEVSQKSNEEDVHQVAPYETLDPREVIAAINRPPPVYANLARQHTNLPNTL